MLARVLDEIDHGLLVVDLTGRILHANHPARNALAASSEAACHARAAPVPSSMRRSAGSVIAVSSRSTACALKMSAASPPR